MNEREEYYGYGEKEKVRVEPKYQKSEEHFRENFAEASQTADELFKTLTKKEEFTERTSDEVKVRIRKNKNGRGFRVVVSLRIKENDKSNGRKKRRKKTAKETT